MGRLCHQRTGTRPAVQIQSIFKFCAPHSICPSNLKTCWGESGLLERFKAGERACCETASGGYLASSRVSSMIRTCGSGGTRVQKQKLGAAKQQPSPIKPHDCLRHTESFSIMFMHVVSTSSSLCSRLRIPSAIHLKPVKTCSPANCYTAAGGLVQEVEHILIVGSDSGLLFNTSRTAACRCGPRAGPASVP